MTSRRSVAIACSAALTLTLACIAPDANAQPAPSAAASAAYQRGVDASANHDYAAAARAFAEADALAPNPVALESAIKAAILADDAALAMDLVDRASRNQDTAALPVVQEARAKFATKVGKLTITCPGESTCDGTVDDTPMQGHEGWFLPGAHTVVLRAGDRKDTQGVAVTAGKQTDVSMRAALAPSTPGPKRPATPAPNDAASSGPDAGAIVFWTGVALTGAATVGALVSMGDLLSKHGDFVDSKCDVTPAAGCTDLSSAGQSAEIRTWVLGGVAAGLAVATVIVGVTAVEWSPKDETGTVALRVGPTGLSLVGTF